MNRLKIIDTHAHLCDSSFDSDREDVLKRAGETGVVSILTVSETLEDGRKNLALSKEHPILHPLAGLCPGRLDSDQADEIIHWIRQHYKGIAGIGEVGLDFWTAKEPSDREIQMGIFIRFIELSKGFDLPLNVHSRSAGRKVIDLLLHHGARNVQLHAFDGKASAALPAVEAGYFFSIPPSVVYSRQKQKLVKLLPLSCLLVETDSPVLGPVPGERNEPKNIRTAVEAVAGIKGLKFEEAAEAVFHNTARLYDPAVC
jgi:TatD DNase family protein